MGNIHQFVSVLVCILRWIQKFLIRVTNLFLRFKFKNGNYQLPLPKFHLLKFKKTYFKLRGELLWKVSLNSKNSLLLNSVFEFAISCESQVCQFLLCQQSVGYKTHLSGECNISKTMLAIKVFKSNRCYRSLPLNLRSARRKLYEIVQSGVIHNLIGQINSNQGRFDRKSIKRHELSCRVRSSHFSFLSVQRPFKYLLRALAIFRNQRKLIFILSWRNLINCFFLNFSFICFNSLHEKWDLHQIYSGKLGAKKWKLRLNKGQRW